MPGLFPRVVAKLAARYYLHKPDLERLIEIKFPTTKSIINAGLNELAFRLGRERSPRLTTVNLEVTNHCNLKCSICPVNRGMKRRKGYMQWSLFRKIIDENPQIEFLLAFQWGEPLLHKDIFRMIRYAHDRGIRTMITSNGTLLNDEVNRRIIESGLTRITFSVDGVGPTHTKIRNYPYEKLKKNILRLKEMKERAGGYPKIDVSMTVCKENEKDVDDFFSQWNPLVDRTQAITVFTTDNRRTRCRELWRGILVVLWDGRVAICCADYEGIEILGDANNEKLADIWNGKRMRELRRLHCRKKFPSICRTCGEYESPKVSKRFS